MVRSIPVTLLGRVHASPGDLGEAWTCGRVVGLARRSPCCGMRVHVLSDLHLERGGELPAAVDADVVVLAGDIGRGVHGLRAAIGWGSRHPILYVAGNHEPYGHGLPGVIGDLRTVAAAANGRARVLERDEIVIGGVRFLGCTLWSDFDVAGAHERARSMAICGDLVNDYRTSDGRLGRGGSSAGHVAARTRSVLDASAAAPL